MAAVTRGASVPTPSPAASEAATTPDLSRDSAELGREIERVRAEMEHGIQLAGLKNDPLMPLLKTLSTTLALQWKLHDQAVTYHRSASAQLDLQFGTTIAQGEHALEARRGMIVQALAPELAKLTARSVRSWNRTITVKTGVTLGAFAVALAFGVGLAGYGAGWQAGHTAGLLGSGALAGAVQQAGPGAEEALIDMVRANNLVVAWAKCEKSAIPDKDGRRVCLMPMWAEPQAQPGNG